MNWIMNKLEKWLMDTRFFNTIYKKQRMYDVLYYHQYIISELLIKMSAYPNHDKYDTWKTELHERGKWLYRKLFFKYYSIPLTYEEYYQNLYEDVLGDCDAVNTIINRLYTYNEITEDMLITEENSETIRYRLQILYNHWCKNLANDDISPIDDYVFYLHI